jgi:S-adenosylmethionine synthetase
MIRTAESVTPCHPDKMCDRISDAILDACLLQDKESRVAIETMGGHGIITITGELTTNAFVDCREIAKRVAGDQYGVQTNIVKQSQEIAQGVDTGGAGDQGIMIGYATAENEAMIPQEFFLSRDLAKYLFSFFPYDGKTQVTTDEDGTLFSVVASFSKTPTEKIREKIFQWAKGRMIGTLHINPCGDWNLCGFEADTGVTGRKLAVDNYGTRTPIGGGAFSGKDPSKVDRSGAYMARKVAVDYLKKTGAKEVYAKIAYFIGIAEPVMAVVEIDGVQEKIKGYNLTPRGIIDFLQLKSQKYEKTAEWGHFGNGFFWE